MDKSLQIFMILAIGAAGGKSCLLNLSHFEEN